MPGTVTTTSDTSTCGSFRAFVVYLDEENRSARVYIPTLHRSLMPFSNPDNPHEGVSQDVNLNSYPVAQIVAPGVYFAPKIGDAVWVMFENADVNYPVITGSIATTLQQGDVRYALYGEGSSSGQSEDYTSNSTNVESGLELSDSVTAPNQVTQKAINWAVTMANKPVSEGGAYYHWGGYQAGSMKNGFDCAKFVDAAFNIGAGLNVGTVSTSGMESAYLKAGFTKISSGVNFNTAAGLIAGDVVVSPGHHAVLYIGDGKEAAAHSASKAKNDQVSVCKFTNHSSGYKFVLRYGG